MISLQRKAASLSLLRNKPVLFVAAKRQPGRAFNLLVGIGTALTITSAVAADYPTRPIRFIVPSGAGSASDINARLVAAEVTRQMGQFIVVDNQAGAAGNIGAQTIAKATPDGYTIGYPLARCCGTGRPRRLRVGEQYPRGAGQDHRE